MKKTDNKCHNIHSADDWVTDFNSTNRIKDWIC
jgi:hypothetical protein